jgi:hypothetical protein
MLGEHRLSPEQVQPYYLEALEVAASVCTESISKYLLGSLQYTRALSRSIPYVTSNGTETSIALGLSAGPVSLFDDTITEQVEIGLVTADNRFSRIATFRSDLLNIPSNGISSPRNNNPEDLDSFMIGVRHIAKELESPS